MYRRDTNFYRVWIEKRKRFTQGFSRGTSCRKGFSTRRARDSTNILKNSKYQYLTLPIATKLIVLLISQKDYELVKQKGNQGDRLKGEKLL